MFRCSVKNCLTTNLQNVSFFNVKKCKNFEEIKDKLVDVKVPKIFQYHFEFKCLNVRLKKGAVPTFFGEIPAENNNKEQIEVAWCLPDHQYAVNTHKKLMETTEKLKKVKAKAKLNQNRKRRAQQKVVSLQDKLGK